ncbi:MAG: exodeoxyribonuclease VII large subunit [Deferribacterales bacterium]
MRKLTVTEITKIIKNAIENLFDDTIAIEGEVSSLSRSPNGHLYFVLKDENAQIKVVLFKKYLAINKGYIPKNGDGVVVIGELSVYEPDGVYQIVARKVEYKEVGNFYKKFEETKRKLEAEGLFDRLLKKDIPLFIKKIAVVTSPSGAAIKDFLKILSDNGIGVEIHLWGVQVQGVQAIPEIVAVLKEINNYNDYDIVILMRGGGSLEDLAIFNDEQIARALANVKKPTITAIGHERDTTIVDFIADLRAPTPTAAANLIVERYANLINIIDNNRKKLTNIVEKRLFFVYQRLDILNIRLEKNSPSERLKRIHQFLELSVFSLKHKLLLKMKDLNSALNYYKSVITKSGLTNRILIYNKKLEIIDQKLRHVISKKLSAINEYINNTELLLRMYDPNNLLKNGYCIVSKDGKVITDVRQVELEDIVEIKMKNGYINSSVIGKKIMEDNSG